MRATPRTLPASRTGTKPALPTLSLPSLGFWAGDVVNLRWSGNLIISKGRNARL